MYKDFGLDGIIERVARQVLNKAVVGLDRPELRVKMFKQMALLPVDDQASLKTDAPLNSATTRPARSPNTQKNSQEIRFDFVVKKPDEGGTKSFYAELKKFDRFLEVRRRQMIDGAKLWAGIESESCEGREFWCGSKKLSPNQRIALNINVERELAMADEIVRLHNTGQRVFSAVGAFHVRPKGLPEMMRARGFEVKFVKHSN